jgi:hypothetical protein
MIGGSGPRATLLRTAESVPPNPLKDFADVFRNSCNWYDVEHTLRT